jgi:hypothetical protein
VVKENLFALAHRLDADVVLVRGRVGEKRLHEKVLEPSHHPVDLDRLANALRDPRLRRVPVGIEQDQASLSAALDELVRLDHQRCVSHPRVLGLDGRKVHEGARLAVDGLGTRGDRRNSQRHLDPAGRHLLHEPLNQELSICLPDRSLGHGARQWGGVCTNFAPIDVDIGNG